MIDVTEIEISGEARNRFPGVSVLACRVDVGTCDNVDAPDWSTAKIKWHGWVKADLLLHPAVAPFAAFLRTLGLNPSRQPPSFANFILRAFAKPDATIPTIHSIVDHVNHVAVESLNSLGVFDAAAVVGNLTLDISRAGELFDPIGGTGPEAVKGGELILRDAEKILSLFSVRDSVHQAITPLTRQVFLLGCVVPGIAASDVVDAVTSAAMRLKSFKQTVVADKPTKSTGASAWFGRYGGMFIPETLSPALSEVIEAYERIVPGPEFQSRYQKLLASFVGRETPLTLATNLSELLNIKTYLKREDLAHTGAHKINNAIGQALLAQQMGKQRIVAETGAGQHGVATAAACAFLRIECTIYMGKRDMERQHLNVLRMRLMGARVVAVDSGSQTLKDAVNEAIRDWVSNPDTTYYLLGSALGPHPYPTMVRDFQAVIGRETMAQFAAEENGAMPDALVACVGGGSNAIGMFHPFIEHPSVQFFGVEAAGSGIESQRHSVRLDPATDSRLGVFQGCRSYVLQDQHGQISETHSLAPGLDYPMVGPEHAWLRETGRAQYLSATDSEAIEALEVLSRCEGIIPALESAHAIAGAFKVAKRLPASAKMVINVSGRGDKDLAVIATIINSLQS